MASNRTVQPAAGGGPNLAALEMFVTRYRPVKTAEVSEAYL